MGEGDPMVALRPTVSDAPDYLEAVGPAKVSSGDVGLDGEAAPHQVGVRSRRKRMLTAAGVVGRLGPVAWSQVRQGHTVAVGPPVPGHPGEAPTARSSSAAATAPA